MDIISIERRLKIQENLYLYLLQKREENELAGSFITSNFRIVNSAGGARTPIFPKTLSIMCIAFIVGFLIPSTYLSIRQLSSTKITSEKDILDNSNIPFLGTIPQVIRRKSKQKNINIKHLEDMICVKHNSWDDINEAFRLVRTNIDFMSRVEDMAKVIMLTSFNEKAGKSFVSLNLAISFAIANKKTLLIDMDMRESTISSCLHAPQTGIANYLDSSDYSLEDMLIKEPFQPCLDIIPVGTLSANPVELLSSKKLNDLIVDLRNIYEYIIIDTTPFTVVADASIIEKIADMTIFVLMETLSDQCRFSELADLHLNKISNMAILLNFSCSARR
jgi:capsular exopolysaccharide synthesis family protein